MASTLKETEAQKSEREKQIPYINTYVWNLLKWCSWNYLQGKNREAVADKGLVDTAGEGGVGQLRERPWHVTYNTGLACVKQAARGKLL